MRGRDQFVSKLQLVVKFKALATSGLKKVSKSAVMICKVTIKN